MNTRENDLIIAFRQGSKKAFEIIYNNYYISIFYFARRFVANSQDAEDITTETFIKLWHMHENFESMYNIRAFLHISTKNACLNYLRYEQRKLSNQKELLYLLTEETDEINGPQQITARIYQLIHDEIEKLPGQLKKIFKMAYVDGFNNEEIAKKLKINNQSVRNHKARALKLLRIALLNSDLLAIIILLKLSL